MKTIFPKAVKACLWSYNTDLFDLSVPDHRVRVIFNVLNYGTSEAVNWLRATFSEKEISEAIAQSSVVNWSKKSLALWSLVFNARPLKEGRFA